MNRIKEYFHSNYYGFTIFGLLIIFMISNPQEELDDDCLCSFGLNYHTGFGGRMLIASIVTSILDIMNPARVLKLVYISAVIGCGLYSYCCNIFIKKMKAQSWNSYLSSIYMVTLYTICPASIMFLLQYPNFGRLDFFLYFSCFLFCFLFYKRNSNRIVYFILLTILMVCDVLTHHIFVATYMSFFVALFIYDIWNKGFDKKLFFCYVILGTIVSATFLSIILFSSMNITLDEAVIYHPNMELNKKFVWFIYYASISDHINLYVLSNLNKLIAEFILFIIFLIPLIIFGSKIWKENLKSKDKKGKNLFWYMQSAFLLFIPAFCITVDQARWFAAFIFLQFLLIAYFAFDKDSLYSNISETMGLFIKNNAFLVAALVVYCSLLGIFGSDRTFECGEFILELLDIKKQIVQLPIGV